MDVVIDNTLTRPINLPTTTKCHSLKNAANDSYWAPVTTRK